MHIDDIEKRAEKTAEYIVATGATVRAAAKKFGVSKSTVHKDITERCKKTDYILFKKAQAVLLFNKSQRHLRGGDATRLKYLKNS